MELNNVLIMIFVIVNSIEYKNKKVIFHVIKELIRTKSGHVTKLIKSNSDFHHSVIYKFIERSKWNVISVHQKFIFTIIKLYDIRRVTFVIDDSIIYRSRKKKTVKGAILYDHSNKSNRSKFVWGQNILMIAAVIHIYGREIALPVIIHLLDYTGEKKANKITSSVKMISIVQHFLEKHKLPVDKINVTFDSFFAKRRLVNSNENKPYGIDYIFQARRDSALFYLPKKDNTVKRGRKRIYGERIRINKFSRLKKKATLLLYGKKQTVYFKEIICKARFANGREVKAVFCRLNNANKINLYISTNTSLSAIDILRQYEKRWKIEPLFNEIKNNFLFKNIWMQSASSYQKFLHLKLWAFIITQLSSINNINFIEGFMRKHLPWRLDSKRAITITNGITQMALSEFLGLLSFASFISKVRKIISRNNLIPNSPYFQRTLFYDLSKL